ncbi:MAG: LysR substrate-binding domain-containing protein, partial [Pseudomonadota bacterium]
AAPRPAIQSNSLTLIRSLVLSNGFAGLLPDHMFTDEIKSGLVARLNVPSTPLVRSAGLITRKEAFHRPLALALAEQIRATIASEAGVDDALLTERAS